jgi:hypothetical protein
MHKVTFYPVGNGDTSQIELANGKRFLFDYRHLKKTENGEGPEINLAAQLRDELDKARRTDFDVVAFTHADADHIDNSTEFFELEHASKYQGKGRIGIKELWVPAAMILESCTPDQRSEEFVIWRSEARHRLKAGSGIRVFSKPEKLKDWLAENGLTVESRRALITDAGQLVPDFTLEEDGIEFFCHSPFISHVDDHDEIRNGASLIFNVRFKVGLSTFDYFAVGDSEWCVLEDIVSTTKAHGNADRLAWDLLNIPHHCSYLALSDVKGTTETTPTPLVKELLLSGKEGAHIISSSYPITDTSASRAQIQPPHVQARNCYQRYLRETDGGQFYVTMEEPSATKPKPLVFNIDSAGLTRQGSVITGIAAAVTASPPRAG